MKELYEKAARDYFRSREIYRRALKALEALPEGDPARKWAADALLARVRQKFGAHGRGLTDRIGCHFSALCDEPDGDKEVEHVVPLNLIHNRILGIRENGTPDPAVADSFPTREDIERYITRFVVGVAVTPRQHKRLNKEFKKSMPEGWDWLAAHGEWNWDTVGADGLTTFESMRQGWGGTRSAWLPELMGRYEKLKQSPIRDYHPVGHCARCAAYRDPPPPKPRAGRKKKA